MEAVFGLIIFLLVVIGVYKIFRLLFRFLNAPPKIASAPREPQFKVEIVYRGGDSNGFQSPGRLDRDPAKYWVPKGKAAMIAGRTISGGMIYVGSKLSGGRSDYSIEAALIDPKLKVLNAARCESSEMPYWPSYNEISPACRGRYLDWLVSGRSDRNAEIGFVFLYFYGLERRMLVDPTTVSVAIEEKRHIRAEVARLLSIYGENRSFASYAEAFLGFTAVLLRDEPLYKSVPPAEGPTWELPLSVRVAIAELARDGLPVPAEWAFAWAWFDPQNSVRTPAQRCKAEMKKLFELRYREKFGDGIKNKPNKRRVKLEYRAASPSIYSIPAPPLDDLPDVTSLTGPIRKLRDLFDVCNNDLDAYSRWLGRNPDSRGSLQAVALLPPELVSSENMGDSAKELNNILATAAKTSSHAVLSSENILKHWSPSSKGKYRKADAVALAQFIEKLGYGIEPDVRFNGPRLDTVDHAVVFKLDEDAPSAPTRDYLVAELTLRLAAAVAVADGIVTEDEQRSLEKQLEASSELRPGDRKRLRAHLEWLLTERPNLAGLKRKLGELKPSTRALLGQTLLMVAAADGTIDPEEIKTIRKLYGQLGLDPESVYSDLHSLAFADAGPAPGPVTVRPEEQAKGYTISAPSEGKGPAHPFARIVLDPKLIEAKRREAQQATALLSSIFSEDDDKDRPIRQASASAANVAGLDEIHSALLMRLTEKEQWSMNEIAEIAGELGLLTDGALETINEAAWDNTDGALLDISDTVTIDQSVLKELLE